MYFYFIFNNSEVRVTYEKSQCALLFDLQAVDGVCIVHKHMLAPVLVQQQHHVVLERGARQRIQHGLAATRL